jgi:uncharacterized protein
MRDAMLTCPKCHGSMRSYERSGVTVDQCDECRGIFLDRGELDRLIDAEREWHSEPVRRESSWNDEYRDNRYDRRYEHGDRDDHRGYPRKRKKSFLDELFD